MIELAHWAALAPLALLVALRSEDARAWLVAFGFSVSWFADTIALASDGSWVATNYYPVLQFALFALAVGGVRAAAFVLLGSVLFVGGTGPDVWLRVFGSFVVLWYARGDRFALALIQYCGAGTLFYLSMIQYASPDTADLFMPWWYAYQSARLAAFVFFAVAVMPRCHRSHAT